MTLSDSERVLLRQAHRACRGQARYVLVTVLLMVDQGYAASTVAQALGVDMSSMYRYVQTCQLHDLAGYLRAEQPGYWGLLTSTQLGGLRRELHQAFYTDCPVIADWLAAIYGVHYSVSGLTGVLYRLGFSCKLTMALLCHANAAAQTASLTDTIALLMVRAAAGEALVYFADGTQPTHNTRATHVWTETSKERSLLMVSGSERVNLNAVTNAHCPTQVHLDETDCVNAQSTQRLYKKLFAAYPGGPVHVSCHNARYYKNKALNAWLADKRLIQVFLPSYSPNLNLIERLRKFLRQKIINTAFYRSKDRFKTAMLDFFDRISGFVPELSFRTRLKFHVLDSQSSS